jgi:hypothetical protein
MTLTTAHADAWTAPDLTELRRYWNDPAYRSEVAANVAAYREQVNAMFDTRAAQEARWAAEGDGMLPSNALDQAQEHGRTLAKEQR